MWMSWDETSLKVSKPTTVFVDNMSSVLNPMNPGCNLNKITVVLSYHFFREYFPKMLWIKGRFPPATIIWVLQ